MGKRIRQSAMAFFMFGAATACSAAPPADAPEHHTASGFQNPPGSPERGSFWDRFPWIFKKLISGPPEVTVPDGHVLPRAEARAQLAALDGQDSVTWIGHMTALLRVGGTVVLTDPWFSERASPFASMGPRRWVPPGLAIADLPPIDVVIVSHDHYDHLDLRTLDRLPDRARITAVVPLGLGDYFRERGFGRVVELDWYDATEAHGLTITALPVIHWSKRSFFGTNETLWAGFAIEAENGGPRLYFGGDAEYGPIYSDVAERYGGFDLALLSVGAFRPRAVMNGVHCTPEDCLRMGLDLDARTLMALHWGTAPLGDDGITEGAELFRAAGRAAGLSDDRVWIPRIGETRPIPRR